MTDQQTEILNKIREMMAEHFDHGVIIVQADDINDDGDYMTSSRFVGTGTMALGLAEQFAFRQKVKMSADLLKPE